MKAAPLLVAWHNDSAPIYSVQFEPNGKGRLATAGGDNHVRLWKLNGAGEDRDVTYLSTLVRHTQAVNVVRWCPRGEMLASAGDDGNVLLWVPSDHHASSALSDDALDNKETWHVKRMCRSTSGAEIYDLAWSPDGAFFVTGSMDNIARIFDAQTGAIVRQIAEHHHYVQGVAWDPLNEFLATQSSDRSVHVYALKTNDGQFSLSQHGRISRMDLPPRRRTSNSPAPPELVNRGRSSSNTSHRATSPAPSAPDTPSSLALPMNPPPPATRSRRSSIGNASPNVRRSASPAPSMPLPAVMPSVSPNPYVNIGAKNANIYANETLTSFFRRLTFAPDGSLLFTPAGQYKTAKPASDELKTLDEITNTVYIYSRAGLNKPPVAHLPGHKKPSIAVKCSPVVYNHRLPTATRQITLDTSAAGGDIAPLPEPAHPSKGPTSDPESSLSANKDTTNSSEKSPDNETGSGFLGPKPAFALPYRIVYAVATQDTVYVYDTQQQSPICVVSNLHYATFTDLTWSDDGNTLLISSSDGFASTLAFSPGELGTKYHGSLQTRVNPLTFLNTGATNSLQPSPIPTPTGAARSPGVPPLGVPKQPSIAAAFAPSPSPAAIPRPASPTRSNSASSIATQQSFPQTPASINAASNAIPTYGKLPSVAAAQSSSIPPLASPTPPMTPLPGSDSQTSKDASGFAVPTARASETPTVEGTQILGKRGSVSEVKGGEGGSESESEPKKRRIAPTLVSE